jgi:hypothetical protein
VRRGFKSRLLTAAVFISNAAVLFAGGLINNLSAPGWRDHKKRGDKH